MPTNVFYISAMVHELSKQASILNDWLAEIRNVTVQQDRLRFRKNLERIAEIAAYEISKTLPYTACEVSTPMGDATIACLDKQPVVATILRAGLPMHQGVMNIFDRADAAFVAAFRKHHRDGSFDIEQKYVTCPNITGRPLLIADPMLASGASLVISIKALLEHGTPSAIHIITAIGCTVGIEHISRMLPEAHIWAAAIDDELTAKGYIVPGLGDAGDLAYGEKKQN